MSPSHPAVVRGGLTIILVLIAVVLTSTTAYAQAPYSHQMMNWPPVAPTVATPDIVGATDSRETTPRPSAMNVAGGNALANWSFETGDFTGWVTKDIVGPFVALAVAGAGNTPSTFGFFTSAPTDGSFSVQHGFDGTGPDTIEVAQDITIPAGTTAQLQFDYRAAWDLATFGATLNRDFSVQVQPAGGGTPMQSSGILTAASGTINLDTGVLAGVVNLNAFVGRTVRIVFYWNIREPSSGPAFFELDNVRLTGDGLPAAYVRSTVGPPWNQSTNEAAMDTAFGAGNWADLRYETLSLGELFAPTRQFVFLEGGDDNADELEAFLTTNQAAIEDWVAAGHCLFVNSAPTEGDGMDFGFGVTLTFTGGYFTQGNAVDAFHPIFNAPFTPITTNFTGWDFAHSEVSGGGIVSVIEDLDTVYGEKEHGAGFVGFGGMTTDNWHSPQPEAGNLRANILYHIADQCFDAQREYVAATWSDDSVNFLNIGLEQTGRFAAGSTDPNGIATDGVIIYSGHWATQEIIGYDFSGAERFRWSGSLSGLQGMELVNGALAVSNNSNVDFFEPTTGAYIRSIPNQSSVEGIAFDGTLLWQLGDSIYGTDPANGSVLTTIPNAASGCTYGGTGITASGRNQLTLACTNGNWFKVHTNNGAVQASGNNGLSMYGAKKVPQYRAPGKLYLTSLDAGDSTFAVYHIGSDTWMTLNPIDTGAQMAVDVDGDLYAYGRASGTIEKYNKVSDSWSTVLPGPPATIGDYGNLEITTAGEFLYTEEFNTNLHYTVGAVWNTAPLGFTADSSGDYDPLTNQYVVGEYDTDNHYLIDVNTLSITPFLVGGSGEHNRFGAVLEGHYYYWSFGSGTILSSDLYDNAAGPVTETPAIGYFPSSALDRANGLIYVGDLNGIGLTVFDADTGVLKPLSPYIGGTWHTSLVPSFSDVIFADGFESGDTSAWSNTVP